jgi:hypothetical protein
MMEDQAPGKQTNEAEEEETQDQGSAPEYTEMVLFCHPRNVANLVQALEDQITHADGALPLFVLWSGHSGVLHQGVIVLEWEGKVTPDFLYSLSIDDEIFDYVIYDWAGEDQERAAGNKLG